MKNKIDTKLLLFLLYQLIFIIIIFFAIEICLRFYFKQTGSYNCYEKTYDLRKYFNGKNCSFNERYFEKTNPTIYQTNFSGARSSNTHKNLGNNNIYFVGDSFTFGYLSNYEETFPFNAIKYLNSKIIKKKYSEINYGVNGYQFKQNLFMIDKIYNFSNNLIVYGLTPNDLFDIQNQNNTQKYRKLSLIDFIKINIDKINLLSVKYLSSIILRNDTFYISIHNKRGESAGYVNKNGSMLWDIKYEIFKYELEKLPKEIKDRLIITIIPQQIQIRLLKAGKNEDALSFDNKIIKLCGEIEIKCISFTENLAENLNYNTHFIKDGHLLPKTNIEYGRLLGEYLHKFLQS